MEEPVFLTVPEVAKILRLKRSTAYEYIRQGIIPSVRIGRFIRVRGTSSKSSACRKTIKVGRNPKSTLPGHRQLPSLSECARWYICKREKA